MTARVAGNRGRGIVPRAPRPRPTSLLGESRRSSRVEHGDSPRDDRAILWHPAIRGSIVGTLLILGAWLWYYVAAFLISVFQ